jgi:hypothetical protein
MFGAPVELEREEAIAICERPKYSTFEIRVFRRFCFTSSRFSPVGIDFAKLKSRGL